MRTDPYLRLLSLRRRHRRASVSLAARLGRLAVPLGALVLLAPLFQRVFLSFLDRDPADWPAGAVAVSLRLGLVAVGWAALDLFAAVIRSPDRGVLAVLPVEAGQVVRAEVARVALERSWVPASAAILLAPLALRGAVDLWAASCAVVAGAWLLGMGVSAAVHLVAVEVAESERFAPLLDLVRGNNPRPQAAFLYAPGVVLGACGALVVGASSAIPGAVGGDVVSALWIALPFAAAALGWQPTASLARRNWFRGSAVLAEIDARYGALVERREGLRVYLDWSVRFLPTAAARYALKDLRHGWRARRPLLTLAWLVGLAALVAGWTSDAAGPVRALQVAIGGTWLCAAVGVLLERDEPEFLRAWLPPGGLPRLAARVVVVALWLQACVLPGALASSLRAGVAEGAWVLLLGEASALGAAVTAAVCGRFVRRGLALYAPTAAVAAAACAAWVAVP